MSGSGGRDLVLRSRRVVTAEGERAAAVRVRAGRIAAIEPYDAAPGPVNPPGREGAEGRVGSAAGRVEDLGDLALLPGLVDTHVHVNEPGRTEWEGFATATRAAAAGGVTTIIDMPLNSVPPTVTVGALREKRRAAAGRCHVDVGFWGGAVPAHLDALAGLHAAGVFGFKCFLIDSGVPEFPPLPPELLGDAMRSLDALFLVHAEDPGEVRAAPASRRYADFLGSRPPAAENRAIATVIEAARRTGRRVHILHLSSAGALPMIAEARSRGVPVTAETCPHYLTLAAEDVPDGATAFKCCPPIREAANREALWRGLADGVIDQVVSDHSPCTPALKRPDTGDFAAAWGGIASLQLGLPLTWTGARARGHGLADVVRWTAERPAALAGLARKGRIAVGNDADLVAFDPEAAFAVDPGRLRHRHPVTPYAGARLHGVVRRTWLRGRPVDLDGESGEPRGEPLSRGTA